MALQMTHRLGNRLSGLKTDARSAWQSAVRRVPEPARAFIGDMVTQTKEHDLSGTSAELAYRLFLALFPFLILLVSLASFIAKAIGVANPAHDIVNSLGSALPSDTAKVIERQLSGVINGRSAGLLSFGIIGTIWAASSGMGSIIKATNRAYGTRETRSYFKRTGLAIGMTVSAGLALLLASVVLIGAQVFGVRIGDSMGIGPVTAIFISIVRFPIAIVLILFAVGVLYWVAPNQKQDLIWISPGAAFFSVAWIIMTSVMGIYVSHFASYNATYGALAGVVILMVWLYFSSFLLLLGAEINAAIEHRAEAREGERAPSQRLSTS